MRDALPVVGTVVSRTYASCTSWVNSLYSPVGKSNPTTTGGTLFWGVSA